MAVVQNFIKDKKIQQVSGHMSCRCSCSSCENTTAN